MSIMLISGKSKARGKAKGGAGKAARRKRWRYMAAA
jgi:hypothetical protein